MANFARHLPFMGWGPHVLTIQDKDIDHVEPGRVPAAGSRASVEAVKAVGKEGFPTFTLSYTGALYVERSPEPIFGAVVILIWSGKVRSEQMRIKPVGHCRSIDGVPTSSLVGKYGLESVVLRDSVPHAEAAEIIRRSPLALLFAPKLAFQIPAKVYDVTTPRPVGQEHIAALRRFDAGRNTRDLVTHLDRVSLGPA
jgi:hypothetical protein